MRVAVFSSCPAGVYSGGRYHALMVVANLARLGHEAHFVTNNKPVFWDDVSLVTPDNPMHLTVSEHIDVFPSGRFDAVFVAPQLGTSRRLYSNALTFAEQSGAVPILINFETPNWFNKYVRKTRPVRMWDDWNILPNAGSLVLCSAKLSEQFAREYYKDIPQETTFDVWQPSINEAALIAAGTPKREKQIISFCRPSDAHKGGDDLLKVMTSGFEDYRFKFVVGNPRGVEGFIEKANTLADAHDIDLEFVFEVSDTEKFRLIKSSEALLFPSQFEGYGYPPIEALACGTRAVCYELPVTRENCGEHAHYAAFGDPEALVKTLRKALNGPAPDPSADQISFRASQDRRAQHLVDVIKSYRQHILKRSTRELSPDRPISLSPVLTFESGDEAVAVLNLRLPRDISQVVHSGKWPCRSYVETLSWHENSRHTRLVFVGPKASFDKSAFMAGTVSGTTSGGQPFAIELSRAVHKASGMERLARSRFGFSHVEDAGHAKKVRGWIEPEFSYNAAAFLLPDGSYVPLTIGENHKDLGVEVTPAPLSHIAYSGFLPGADKAPDAVRLILYYHDEVVGVSEPKELSETPYIRTDARIGADDDTLAESAKSIAMTVSEVKAFKDQLFVRASCVYREAPPKLSVARVKDGQVLEALPFEIAPNIYRPDISEKHGLDAGYSYGVQMAISTPDRADVGALEFILNGAPSGIACVPQKSMLAPKSMQTHALDIVKDTKTPEKMAASDYPLIAMPKIAISNLEYNVGKKTLSIEGWALVTGKRKLEVINAKTGKFLGACSAKMRADVNKKFGLNDDEKVGFTGSVKVEPKDLDGISVRLIVHDRAVGLKDAGMISIVGNKDVHLIDAHYSRRWGSLWARGFATGLSQPATEVVARQNGQVVATGSVGIKQMRAGDAFAGWRFEDVVSDTFDPNAETEFLISYGPNMVSRIRKKVATDIPALPLENTDFVAQRAKYGLQGLVAKAFPALPAETPKRVVLAVHNLHAPERPEKRVFVNELKAALAAKGVELIVFHHAQDPSGTDAFEVNFFDPTLDYLSTNEGYMDDMADILDWQSVDKDPAVEKAAQLTYGARSTIASRPMPWDESVETTLVEARRVAAMFKALKPDAVLVWHQWNSLMQLVRTAAERQNIPSGVVHEGVLPSTLSFDTVGMMGESESRGAVLKPQLKSSVRPMKLASEMIDAVYTGNLDRKPASKLSAVDKYLSHPQVKDRPVLFYAGINDWQSGTLPVDAKSGYHSHIYRDTMEGLHALIEVCEQEDWYILFKPHPNLYPGHFSIDHPNVIFARESNVLDCLKKTAATVTILSSVAYISLANKKPTVLLGHNQLSETGAVYELSAREELKDVLQAAINADDLEARLEKYQAHVAALIRDHLYPYGDKAYTMMKDHNTLAADIVKAFNL